MDETRASEIIAAYGGDPARWPADEREAALAIVRRSPALARERAEASRLDALLDAWARDDAGPLAGSDGAADAALSHARPGRHRWLPLAAAGSLAAAVAAGLLLVQPSDVQSTGNRTAMSTEAERISADAQLWAQVFTPTPEEESLI